MSTSDSMGDGPPSKKARFGDDTGKPENLNFTFFMIYVDIRGKSC